LPGEVRASRSPRVGQTGARLLRFCEVTGCGSNGGDGRSNAGPGRLLLIRNDPDDDAADGTVDAIEEEKRDAAERIKALMFTFDDLVKLDAGSAQTLMRNIDKDKLAVALKGAKKTVRQFFFTNMSSRAAKMLVEDMQAMGPVRLRDVDEAQALLVNVAKDLALDRKVGAAIDIYVNNWLVARGEAVLVEEKLGITMT
jgi:hypothetical protein